MVADGYAADGWTKVCPGGEANTGTGGFGFLD
jgi:hypothetical protein